MQCNEQKGQYSWNFEQNSSDVQFFVDNILELEIPWTFLIHMGPPVYLCRRW